MFKPIHRERMITVTDDWYPCYENNQIRLRLIFNNFKDKYYIRLSAWGNDDFGLELYTESTDLGEMRKRYKKLLKMYETMPNGINQNYFYNLGFTRF